MFNRLEKERQSLRDKVDHLESERQQLSGTVEEVKKLCREADEKYAAVEEERDRLNEQLQEHGDLNKTLKLELNMYNTMAEQQKAPQGNNSKRSACIIPWPNSRKHHKVTILNAQHV